MKIKLVHKHLPGEHDQQSHTPKGYDGNETKTIPKYKVGDKVLFSGIFMGRRVENKKAVISKEPEVNTSGDVYYTMSIRAYGGTYNAYAHENEIKEIKKITDDKFWVLEVGGEKYDLRKPLEAKYIDKYDDVKESPEGFGKGYMLTGDDRLIDAETGKGNNDHSTFIATSEARTDFGLTARDARDLLVGNLTLGSGEVVRGWKKIYKSGAIRVREAGDQVSIEMPELNTRALRRLQRLYDSGKLGLKIGDKITIQAASGELDYINTTYEEFLSAKYIAYGKLKEYKRLVFTYRPTNP